MIETIQKLIKSDDIADGYLAMELMFNHMSIPEIKAVFDISNSGHIKLPYNEKGVAFTIGPGETVCFCEIDLWLSLLDWTAAESFRDMYLKEHWGNHKDYKL